MHPLIAAALLAVVQDSGAFVVRLGTDTLSLEMYQRSPGQVRGDYLIRSPRSTHRIYTADMNPDGSYQRLELIVHNISGGPGPAEIKQTIVLMDDSAMITMPRGDSVVTTRVAVPKGTVFWQTHVYGLLEYIGGRARRAGGDSVAITGISFGATAYSGGVVRKKGGDTLQLAWTQGPMAGLGPFTFRLDARDRLVWLSGKGSTVQVEVERLPSVDLTSAGPSFADRPLGQLSVRDTARATLGTAELWVDYGRPMKRGREIFGSVVPWNTVWRTGANQATHFNTPVDLVIGGASVPAGRYTLWSLPSPTGWKLIINKQTGQWGTLYDAAQDLVRVDAKVETLTTPVEQFVIAFEPAGAPAAVTFTWDRTKVSVPVAPGKRAS